MSQPYNPYSSPQSYGPPGGPGITPTVPGKLLAPAIMLALVGVLDAGYGVVNLLSHVLGWNEDMQAPPQFADNPQMQEFFNAMNESDPVVGGAVSALMIAAGLVILAAGIQMMRMKTYPLAMTGSILSMIPCLTCLGCCGAGQAVGVWSLVILCSADVRELFRS